MSEGRKFDAEAVLQSVRIRLLMLMLDMEKYKILLGNWTLNA